MKTRRASSLLLIAAVLHGLVYMLLLPPWMGEDEPWHVEYAHHISTGHPPWGGIEMHGADREENDDRRLMPLSQLQVRRRIGELKRPKDQSFRFQHWDIRCFRYLTHP